MSIELITVLQYAGICVNSIYGVILVRKYRRFGEDVRKYRAAVKDYYKNVEDFNKKVNEFNRNLIEVRKEFNILTHKN